MKHEKIAPGLMAVLEDFSEKGEVGLRSHRKTLGVVPSEGRPKPSRVVVFIHTDERKDFGELMRYGVHVNQAKGRIRTAIVPLESLDPLSEDPAVERIVAARYLRPRMNVALPKCHIPQFRSSGLSGSGVIVGIVDSGIDVNHPAFQGRILRVWDQALSGPGVPEGNYGLEVTSSTLSASKDEHGHGTHVAGIAAGADNTFSGVAPAANYVIVKTDFMDTHIADGIRYIFRVAKDMQRPAVVNLSLGGHFDAHDGSDSLSQIIDSESGAGRIVCCAAGNEGNDNIHAQNTVNAAKMRRMRFLVPDIAVNIAVLNGWYPGSCTFEVSVRTPGRFITPWQSVIPNGNPAKTYKLPDGEVTVVTPGPDPANGDHNFWIEMKGTPPELPLTGGIWQLRIRNTSNEDGEVNVWTLDDRGEMVFFTGTSVKDSMKIGSPGAAAGAVTVASYTTKVQWTDINGNDRSVGLDLNDISDFSSEGPLRKGAKKPDVTAPGAMIASCLSSNSSPNPGDMVTQQFRMMAGTSMATPFIAGLIALLLERDAKLDPSGMKQLLRAHSMVPGKPAGTFNPKWGYGLIDANGL
jgi:subtilisin family serine protease